jgi:hypothetical protein
MNMTTIAQKVYFAHFYETSGTLAKVNGELVFFGDDETITVVEPGDVNFLAVLGEVGLANARQIVDRIAGGYAAQACNRHMEVA